MRPFSYLCSENDKQVNRAPERWQEVQEVRVRVMSLGSW